MIFYSSVYTIFMLFLIGLSFWTLLKPGHISQRAEVLYNHPMEQISLMTFLFLICSYPILVIISLLSISKRLSSIEKIIKKSCKKK